MTDNQVAPGADVPENDVVVLGLGKVGLPLAALIANSGHKVIGVDSSPQRLREVLDNDVSSVMEPGLNALITHALAQGSLEVSDDLGQALSHARALIICIPIHGAVGGNKSSILDSIARLIKSNARPELLVILETTVPVGTSRERLFAAINEELEHKVHVVFSPERIFSGKFFETFFSWPKIVGGVEVCCADLAESLYRTVSHISSDGSIKKLECMKVSSIEASELSKLMETTYRDVNIALANTFAEYCDRNEIDFYEAKAAANSQPFSHIHEPGLNVGGHCIPVYPMMYLENHPSATLVAEARRVNQRPARLLANMLMEIAAKNSRTSRLLILGLSYRENVKEVAFSGASELIRELEASNGIEIQVFDPLFSNDELKSHTGVTPASREDFNTFDFVVINSFHDEMKDISVLEFKAEVRLINGRPKVVTLNDADSPIERFGQIGSLGSAITA